ncbi:hybrid sensor histidine kinase/response regulator [Phormidium sp. CLA17]|uniref:hybrid sensor histidine kinase/response regulator n=1 Tax=Leptolyngbya sp. Cla-17 TaxID=2803751 RepID=UPI001490C21C|nr:hybrid sensor histidine kinase/response regulator [Leptolyngbya sp. Cla-17]MBM0742223.1 hybrid sensor histidine kinase/response regulator [Leptolyngbya sp. Cla-17]
MNSSRAEASVILLVDDNATNLSILVQSLSEAGYKVRVAQNGESAIAQVPSVKPDLILLDVMMQGIDGFETCRRLKAVPETQAIPIIFMTTMSDVFDKVKGFQVGAVDYITKPFEIEEALVRVSTHLAIQKLQNQLQTQTEQLQAEICDRQKAQEAVQVFLNAVSHDLRNPVTGGLMVLKSLDKEAEAQGGAVAVSRSILQRMIQSHDRQLALINSLLETHANDMSGVTLECQAVDLFTLVNQLAIEWQPMLEQDESVLQNQVASDLPLVNADSNQLWRVYENLIANALKHNPLGVTLTLTAEVEQVPHATVSMMRCTVHDNGIGIPAEQAASIFELYKRGEPARRTVGLGLGLYLCRQIILAHGGQIGFTSHPETGSTFWFTLPLFEQAYSLYSPVFAEN